MVSATPPTEPPDLRPARFADFPAMSALESQFLPDVFAPDDRRRLFEDNPLWPRLADSWPLGWVLEDSNQAIIGSVTNVPSAYLHRGEEKICANGLAWAVSPEHRGYAAWLMDEYFTQDGADLFVSSWVGVDANPVWRTYGTPVPLGDWSRTAYLVTDRRAVARAALARKGIPGAAALSAPAAVALGLKERITSRPLPRPPHDIDIAPVRTFDDRFEVFWEELRAHGTDKLLGVRDRRTLDWHYAVPLRSDQLRIYTANRNGRIRAYCVLKRHDRPRVRSMKLVDYQTVDTSVDLLPSLLRAAVTGCASEGIAVLEHDGCDIPKMSGFDEFAPYRTDLAAWCFYFQAPDPTMASDLADPRVWDPSAYDGDATYM